MGEDVGLFDSLILKNGIWMSDTGKWSELWPAEKKWNKSLYVWEYSIGI